MDIADDVFFEPLRRGEPTCGLKNTALSCVEHHSSLWYTAVSMVQGTVGALCACFGAGTADPADFTYIMKYPPEFQKVLSIKNERIRLRALADILDGNAPPNIVPEPVATTQPLTQNTMGSTVPAAPIIAPQRAPAAQAAQHHTITGEIAIVPQALAPAQAYPHPAYARTDTGAGVATAEWPQAWFLPQPIDGGYPQHQQVVHVLNGAGQHPAY